MRSPSPESRRRRLLAALEETLAREAYYQRRASELRSLADEMAFEALRQRVRRLALRHELAQLEQGALAHVE